MATVIFGTDPAAEARALVTTLSLWLAEQPRPEQAPPAEARFEYNNELLHLVVITLDDKK